MRLPNQKKIPYNRSVGSSHRSISPYQQVIKVVESLNTYLDWYKEHKFVCVTLLHPKKENKHIYGYIMNIDVDSKRMLIYDDDAKKVIIKSFNEIDDIRLSSK